MYNYGDIVLKFSLTTGTLCTPELRGKNVVAVRDLVTHAVPSPCTAGHETTHLFQCHIRVQSSMPEAC